MDWIGLYTRIEGRISRKPFWTGVAILAAIQVVVQILTDQFRDGEKFAAALDLVLAYPEFAVFAKRGHDRNLSALIVAALFVLAAMTDVLVLAGVGLNRLTQPMLYYLVVVPIGLFALVIVADLGFRRGTAGANRFGPDPLAARGPG